MLQAGGSVPWTAQALQRWPALVVWVQRRLASVMVRFVLFGLHTEL
jgi:hypothetical protein